MNTFATPALEQPVTKAKRIEVVDALRGFAVFGILVSHCFYLFFMGSATMTQPQDRWTAIIISLLVNDKFYSLFSLLFGLSFSLMLLRTTASASAFYGRFAWRLVLLGIIGILHNLHWNDDILSIYAVLGFVLLATSRLNDKVIMVFALLLLLNAPSYLIDTFRTPPTPEEVAASDASAAAIYQKFEVAMKQGSYLDTVEANISVFSDKIDYYVRSGRFSFMLGFFFLGLIAGRAQFFQRFEENRMLFRKIFVVTISIAVVLSVAGLIRMLYPESISTEMKPYARVAMQFQSNFLTIAYATGISLLFAMSRFSFVARQFAAVGKMALTNYVLHSVIGTILLCGYGFGLLNLSIPAFIATLGAIPIFLVMIAFSRVWMKYFNYGPLEWVWRSATLLKAMPLRKERH